MKLTAFDDLYPAKIAAEGGALSTSDGSNSGYAGGDVVGAPGDLSVIRLRSTVSLGSNLSTGAAIGDTLTIIQTAGSVVARFATPSNSGVSFGSNATRVSETAGVGALSTAAREDHRHDGIGTITASASNTMQRGTFNLRPGSGIALALSDSDGDGEFDTATIVNTGGSAGGGGAAGGAPANPRYPVSSGYSTNANTNSRAITMSATPTNGNIIYLISCIEGSTSVSSITQTNVTWTKIDGTSAGSAPVVEIWKGVVGASAGTGITVAYSASSYGAASAIEISNTAGTLDQSATRTGDNFLPIITPTDTDAIVLFGVSQSTFGAYYGGFNGSYMIQFPSSGDVAGAYFGWAGTNTPFGRAIRTNATTGTLHSIAISVI